MVCNHDKPQVSTPIAREEHFYRREKEVGRAGGNEEFMALHWLSPRWRENSSSPLGSAIVTGCGNFPSSLIKVSGY